MSKTVRDKKLVFETAASRDSEQTQQQHISFLSSPSSQYSKLSFYPQILHKIVQNRTAKYKFYQERNMLLKFKVFPKIFEKFLLREIFDEIFC